MAQQACHYRIERSRKRVVGLRVVSADAVSLSAHAIMDTGNVSSRNGIDQWRTAVPLNDYTINPEAIRAGRRDASWIHEKVAKVSSARLRGIDRWKTKRLIDWLRKVDPVITVASEEKGFVLSDRTT